MEAISRITYGVISLVVIVLLIATTIIPVIEDSQTIVTEAVFSNEEVLTSGEYGSYSDSNVELVFDLSDVGATSIGDAKITYNGKDVTMRSGFNRHEILVTNSLYIEIDGASYSNKIFYVTGIDSTDTMWKGTGITFGNYIFTISYNISNKTVTISSTNEEFTTIVFQNQNYFWSISPKDQYSYSNSATTMANVYVGQKDIDNNTVGILSANATVTVSNVTYQFRCIYDKGGVHVITDYTGAYTVTYSWGDLTLVDGSTDVYKGASFTFTLTVNGEDSTLTPLRTFLKYEVEGHETSNSNSMLLAIIPLVAMVVPIMLAANMITSRRD